MASNVEVSKAKCTVLDFRGIAKKSVEEVLDVADGVYLVVKDAESKILWCNQNFADLVGQTKEEAIGSVDPRAEHVAHDKAVLKEGKPLLNLHESIVDATGQDVAIVTQKGIVRQGKGSEQQNIGITVCFAKDAVQKDAEYWKKRLELQANPLGGVWAPVISRSAGPDLPPIYSTNYYMLTGSDVLQLHKLAQDEQWFFHAGYSIRLHIFHFSSSDPLQKPKYETFLIGGDQGALQNSVPAGTWFGADLPDLGFSLSSCSLAPGWTPSSSTIPDSSELASLKAAFASQPDMVKLIERLSPPSQHN